MKKQTKEDMEKTMKLFRIAHLGTIEQTRQALKEYNNS